MQDEALTIDPDLQLQQHVWNALVKLRAGYACEECGYVPPTNHVRGNSRNTGLHAHHLDGNRANNSLRNGQCLCHSCHARASALMRHAAGDNFGRRSWQSSQVECEHCGRLVLADNYAAHLKARHKTAAKSLP